MALTYDWALFRLGIPLFTEKSRNHRMSQQITVISITQILELIVPLSWSTLLTAFIFPRINAGETCSLQEDLKIDTLGVKQNSSKALKPRH